MARMTMTTTFTRRIVLLMVAVFAFGGIAFAEARSFPFIGFEYGKVKYTTPATALNSEIEEYGDSASVSVGASTIINNVHKLDYYLTSSYMKLNTLQSGGEALELARFAMTYERSTVGFGFGYQIAPSVAPRLDLGIGPFIEARAGTTTFCGINATTLRAECLSADAVIVDVGLTASATVAKYITPYIRVSTSGISEDNGTLSGSTVSFGIKGNLDIFGSKTTLTTSEPVIQF